MRLGEGAPPLPPDPKTAWPRQRESKRPQQIVSRILLNRPRSVLRSFIYATYPEVSGRSHTRRAASPSLLGLAPRGVYPAENVTILAVSSYLAFSTLPAPASRHGRYVFCGTFPRIAPGGRYPPRRPSESGLSPARMGRDRILCWGLGGLYEWANQDALENPHHH